MKKYGPLLYVNLLFISANFILNYFYQKNNFDFTLKCISSLVFALLGVINLIYVVKQKAPCKKFYILQASALIFAMLGDILIGINFIAGAATFAVGHIIFVFAYCVIHKFTGADIIPGLVLFLGAAAFLLFYPQFDFKSQIFKIVCLVYSFIISIMLGKAFSNFLRSRSILNFSVLAGSILFFFSDLMLALGRFSNAGRWSSHACMATYYPALCILAFSMYIKLRTDKTTRT